jgi:ubiquinone/menaquinone biosynthesis C-methylase UbiE
MRRGRASGHSADLSAGIKFHEEIASAWSSGYRRKSFSKRLLSFLSILDRTVKPGQDWLDLGCGSGILTKELLDRHATVVAVDGSPAMLNEVKKLQRSEWPVPLTFAQSDVKDLSMIRDRSCDGVLCSSVIEYVDDPNSVLEEIARVLRPDGLLILSIPPKWSALRTIQKSIRWFAALLGKEKYKYLFVSRFEIDPDRLFPWLSNAGFSITQVTHFDPLVPGCLSRFIRPSLMIIEARRH